MGDYQRHTGHLTLAQDGAYRRMMDHYYSTEKPLPADRMALYRICGALEKEERKAVDSVVDQFFSESDGLLYHQRIEEEVQIAQEKIANLKENASNGGKQSGKSRSSKNEANASADGEAKDEAKSNISQKSIVNRKTRSKTNTQPTVALPSWLPDEIWQDWVEYRKSIKAALTQRAAELCLSRLQKLMSSGENPISVIEQSIMSGKWTGLFPVKKDFCGSSRHQTNAEKTKAFADALTGKSNGQQPDFININ